MNDKTNKNTSATETSQPEVSTHSAANAKPAKSSNSLTPLPGLDVVGRGIYLRPRQPYELRKQIFPQQHFTEFKANEAHSVYGIPRGYAVNDSPPMPAGYSINRVEIEESSERLDKSNSLDAEASCGTASFSVNISGSQAGKMQRNEDAFYATRTSFIPFWTIYLADPPAVAKNLFDVDIPVPFKYAHRKQYEAFFQRFGSHYVKRAWIGGKATLTFSVLKSSNMSEEQIRAGIKASYGNVGQGSVNSQMEESKQSLQNNSECEVNGQGGDATTLALLSTLDENLYNQWVKSINDNPQTIELEVAGIWNLIDDESKANALIQAYKSSSIFEPISAAMCIDQTLYFIRNRNYFIYDAEKGTSFKSQTIASKWPQLKEMGFHCIDACLSGSYIGAISNNPISDSVFFFYQNHYTKMNIADNTFSEPKLLSEGFPGLPFTSIDAALHFEPSLVYFFCGNQYVRFNLVENCVEPGYPALISERWAGVNFDKIDAAVYWGNGKIYFFRDDLYIRYDVSSFAADPGYPKQLLGNYVEDWKLFV